MMKSKHFLLNLWQRFTRIVLKLPNKAAIGLILLYRAILSPSAGVLRYLPFYPRPVCIFYPTCSEYGIQAFQKYPFITALRKTATRIGRCHPSSEPGVDLV